MTTHAMYTLSNHDLHFEESVEGKKYVLKIKDLPNEDKPREKMLAHGSSALTVAELVIVLLQTGTKKEDVRTMASRIIKEYGERALSNQVHPKKLSDDLNIPIAKAMQITACAELGRRFYEKRRNGPQVIRTAKDVFEYLQDMRHLPKEHFRGLYVNSHHRIIHDEVISIGTVDSNLVHPREVFKPAIEHGAMAVILAHNHPSGIPTPSIADIEITKHIVAAGKIIGIPVIDHVIIGRNKFISIDVGY